MNVVSYVVVGEAGVENFEVGVVHIFEDDGGSFRLTDMSTVSMRYSDTSRVCEVDEGSERLT